MEGTKTEKKRSEVKRVPRAFRDHDRDSPVSSSKYLPFPFGCIANKITTVERPRGEI